MALVKQIAAMAMREGEILKLDDPEEARHDMMKWAAYYAIQVESRANWMNGTNDPDLDKLRVVPIPDDISRAFPFPNHEERLRIATARTLTYIRVLPNPIDLDMPTDSAEDRATAKKHPQRITINWRPKDETLAQCWEKILDHRHYRQFRTKDNEREYNLNINQHCMDCIYSDSRFSGRDDLVMTTERLPWLYDTCQADIQRAGQWGHVFRVFQGITDGNTGYKNRMWLWDDNYMKIIWDKGV